MKEEYQKPAMISSGKIEGVAPAAFPAIVAGFVTGVAAGTQVNKMVNGRADFQKHLQLVEAGVAL